MRVRPSVSADAHANTYLYNMVPCMYAARASDREECITVAGRCWAGGERNFFFRRRRRARGSPHIGIQRVHNNVSCTYIYIYMWYAYNTVGRGGVGEECDVAVTYYAAAAVGMLTPPSSECILLWKRPSTRREAYCTSSESRVFRLRRGPRERLLLPRGVFGGGRNSGLGGIG